MELKQTLYMKILIKTTGYEDFLISVNILKIQSFMIMMHEMMVGKVKGETKCSFY